jgi:hypothetical protein
MSCSPERFPRESPVDPRWYVPSLSGEPDPMKRSFVIALATLGASGLFACLGRVANEDATGESTNPLDCTTSQRFFNGSCRPVCTTSAECSADTRCMAVDGVDAVCLDDAHCTYLESDTQCFGTGVSYTYSRFGLETVPYDSTPPDASPYDTSPYVDSYFSVSPGSEYPYTSPSGDGCQGDAQFVKIAATGDVACGQSHTVDRCRRDGDACVLVTGTTVDLVSP